MVIRKFWQEIREATARQWIFLFLGIMIDQLGVAMCAQSNFGISAVSFVSYSLSEAFPAWSFGTWSFLFQITLTLALMAVTKTVSLRYILAFGVSSLSGRVLDIMRLAVRYIPTSFPSRCLSCGLGIAFIAVGVCLTIESGLPIQPKDMFARELSAFKHWRYQYIKTAFDLCCVSFSCLVLFVVRGQIYGIGAGTLLSAVLMGSAISFVRNMLLRMGIIEKSAVI